MPEASVERLPEFMIAIEQVRASLSREAWIDFCATNDELIRWRSILSEDPYTRHGTTKPRGYPGDAVLMDYAYRHRSIEEEISLSSDLGKAIYAVTSAAPQTVSAKLRIAFMAEQIVQLGTQKGSIKLASYASGHGRELEHLDSRTAGQPDSRTAGKI